MQTIRTSRRETAADALPAAVMRALPYRLSDEVRRFGRVGEIEEIRMRAQRRCSLVVSGENLILDTVLGQDEISSVLEGICQ